MSCLGCGSYRNEVWLLSCFYKGLVCCARSNVTSNALAGDAQFQQSCTGCRFCFAASQRNGAGYGCEGCTCCPSASDGDVCSSHGQCVGCPPQGVGSCECEYGFVGAACEYGV